MCGHKSQYLAASDYHLFFGAAAGRGFPFGLLEFLFSPRIPNTLEDGTKEETVALAPAPMPEFLESETCEKWKRPFR